MLTYHGLAELERSLRGTKVLSVYADGDQTDAAGRPIWRHLLERETEHARAALVGAPAAERRAFDRCVAQLWELLPLTRVALYPPGWVAFITLDRVAYSGSVHVPAPTSVSWRDGIRVAPYVRALKQQQPAVVAVVDSTQARVYRYLRGSVEQVQGIHAYAHLDRPEHMGDPPEGTFHSGTRGRTGTDEAERARRAGRALMMRRLAPRLVGLAGSDGWILLGGVPEAVRELAAALPERIVSTRVHFLSELDAHATVPRIAAAAERGATLQRRAQDLTDIREVLDHAAAGGKGVARAEMTLRALRESAVRDLYFTERFLREHPDEAEALVRAAFDHASAVEQASGEAADRLDAEAGGVAGRLRYVAAGVGQ